MPNMSYCRFRNTAMDLATIRGAWDEEDLGVEEQRARSAIYRLAQEIAELDEPLVTEESEDDGGDA